MPKYKITIEYDTEIEADDEEQAVMNFFNDEVYDTQSDADSFISQNLTVEELEGGEKDA